MTLVAPLPTTVFLEVSRPCNLRCVQCDIYKFRNLEGELTLSERSNVIEEVASWGNGARIVFTGGELFLDRSRLYETAAVARKAGVYVTVNTNGTLLNGTDFSRLPGSGVRCVVVSIDSDLAEEHDRIRGVMGTYQKATRALRALTGARQDRGLGVLTSTILGSHNLGRIDEMIQCFEELGADTLLFQPIQPNFGGEYRSDWWRTSCLFPREEALVNAGIDSLIRAKEAGHRLYQTVSQFEDMRAYFQNPSALAVGQCGSASRNLMVDTLGQVSLCFHMERLGLVPVGNVRASSLQEIWSSDKAAFAREKMFRCTLGCGTMICHAR